MRALSIAVREITARQMFSLFGRRCASFAARAFSCISAISILFCLGCHEGIVFSISRNPHVRAYIAAHPGRSTRIEVLQVPPSSIVPFGGPQADSLSEFFLAEDIGTSAATWQQLFSAACARQVPLNSNGYYFASVWSTDASEVTSESKSLALLFDVTAPPSLLCAAERDSSTTSAWHDCKCPGL